MYDNEVSKPITPREVRAKIKERYTLPKNVIDYVNEQILLSFDILNCEAFVKHNDFVTHFGKVFAEDIVDDWWKRIVDNFSDSWRVMECNLEFPYSRLYKFKEKKIKTNIV